MILVSLLTPHFLGLTFETKQRFSSYYPILSLFTQTQRARERMGIALVSVPAPHQSLLSQRPNISSNTWLHGSATTSIRYPSKLTILHCSSSTSVVEEGLPPPPPPDSIPVQSESATNDTDKLPLRYYNFLILNSCQPSLDIDKFFNLENHYQLSS